MSADLIVQPTIQGGQVISWELCYNQPTKKNCGTGKSSAPYPKLDFDAGSGDHNIMVTIVKGQGVTFNPTDPLWIQPDTKPLGPIVAPTNQIDPAKIHVVGQGKTLKFHDANSNVDTLLLKYQLNFVGPGNATSTIDPDITNGGKGRSSDLAILLIEAAVIAALVSALVSAFVAMAVARRTIERGSAKPKMGAGTGSSTDQDG